jgi:hypothetical protein
MTVRPQNRAKSEKMGVAFVRLDIAMGQFIVSDADQKEAFGWLNEEETSVANLAFWAMIILAAVAACIAA